MFSDIVDKSTGSESYIKISQKEEAENDKYRLKKKFGFSQSYNNSPAFKKYNHDKFHYPYSQSLQSLKKGNKNSQSITQHTTANVSSTSSLIKNNTLKKEDLIMFPIEEKLSKSISKQTKKSSELPTEKENREEYLTEIQMKNHFKHDDSFSKPSSTPPIDKMNDINNRILDGEYDDNSETYRGTNNIKDSSQINTQNDNISVGEYYNKLNHFFLKATYCSCNITLRLVNDEYNNGFSNHYLPPDDYNQNKSFYFISDINKAHAKINISKSSLTLFDKLNDQCLYHLFFLSFNLPTTLFNLNSRLRKRMFNILHKKFNHIIKAFKEKYCSVLKVLNVFIKRKVFLKNNKQIPLMNLVLTSELITNSMNQCYDISYKYIKDKIEYLNTWRFDIRRKKEYGQWFSSEIETFNQLLKYFCYTQSISSFSKGDILHFHLNIFSLNNKCDTNTILFQPIASFPCSPVPYEKNLQIRNECYYDANRSCEIEKHIHIWKDIRSLKKKCNIHVIKELFKEYFDIKEIFYDLTQFYFIKYIMKAKKIGIMKRNSFLNYNIEIIPYDKPIINEIQCLGVLNINRFLEKYMIRLNTYIIFYTIEI